MIDEKDTTTSNEGAGNTGDAGQVTSQGDILAPVETPTASEALSESQATPATPAPSSGLSKDDVKEILEGAFAKMPQAQQALPAQSEPQMSQEDFEKSFNVFKATPDLLTQLRSESPEIALKAFHAFRDGLIRQAMTMAEFRVQQRFDQLLSERIEPLQSYVTEQQASSFRNDFFKQYSDLEKYEPIVDAVAAKLEKAGFRGRDRAEVMAKFAAETKVIIKQLTATGASNGDSETVKTSTGSASGKNRMSTLTGGGQQSGGQRSAKAVAGPPGSEIFDD